MTIDLSKLSTPDLEKWIHIQATLARQEEAAKHLQLLRDYYDGEQPTMLTARQQEYLGPLLTDSERKFAHNIVKPVVDLINDRLSINGFTVNGQDAGDQKTAEEDDPAAQTAALFWQWWKDWRMDAQQDRLYKRTLRDGYSYVMVDYDAENERPRATLHKLDDGTEGIVYHRDPSDVNRVLFATRYFWDFDPLNPATPGTERKTVYLPHEIRKYKRGNGNWEAVMDEEDKEWPIPWRDRNGKPLGVTVFEFQDPDEGVVDDLISLQNGLNKSWLDLFAAADNAGFPILASEYERQQNPQVGPDDTDLDDDDEMIIAPGRMLEIFGGHIKRIEGANLEHLINVIWTVVSAVALVSRMPQHEFKPIGTTQFPSGEALTQAETGLVSKAEKRFLMYGQAWVDVMMMARRLEDTFGKRLPELKPINVATKWRDANTRMRKVEAEVAGMHKALGVPDDAVWAQAGYSPEQIAHFREEERRNQATKIATIAGALRPQQNGNNAAATQPQGQGGQEAAPENLNSTKGLNGIQIRAAVELLEKVANGLMSPVIALELLVTLGIERQQAQAMVNEAGSFVAANPLPDEEEEGEEDATV
jgi:hypothetical protein